MNPVWTERRRVFLRYIPLTNRPNAEAAIDRLLQFNERMSQVVKLDDQELQQPSIAFMLPGRRGMHLWKAYAKDDKVEFLSRWTKTLSTDEQHVFLDLWEGITTRRLPSGGKQSVPTLRFRAVADDRLWPRIEELLQWACTLPS